MQQESVLTIKTPVYEGPLDLLLELIEKRKLLINDISLADVTDEYIAHLNSAEELPVGQTADFIALAATLLLIKSRSLLPTLTLSEEENSDIKELEYRLALYQLIKEAGVTLKKTFGEHMLYEGVHPEATPQFIPDEAITPTALREAAQALIDGFPKTFLLPKVAVRKILSIEEVIDKLSTRIASAMSLSFKEFSGHGRNAAKPDVIITFLALLELVKQGIIKANQDQHFADIRLENDAVSVPSYE